MNSLNQKTILIVEDDAIISLSICQLLEDNDYTVLSAPNGAEALKILKTSAFTSLILLDLMMPVMDGFQFRQNQLSDPTIKDIPVVVMSADGHIAQKKEQTQAL